MGKAKRAAVDPYAKRHGENFLEWRSRCAALDLEAKDKSRPLVSVEASRHGDYRDEFVTHVESNTIAKAPRNRVSNIVDRWFREGGIGFDGGAKIAVERCLTLWEARPTIGQHCAKYEPHIPSGGNPGYENEMDLKDELDTFRGWFPTPHWLIFENVVRWGQPAGVAGSDMAANPAQAIASAKAVVGMVASYIAAKRGY